MNVETMGEGQGRALLDVGFNLRLVQPGLMLVRRQNHHQVRPGDGVRYGHDHQARRLGLGRGSGPLAQADARLDAGVLEVVGMGVALGTVTYDSDLLALDQGEVGVFVVVDVHVMVSCCYAFSW